MYVRMQAFSEPTASFTYLATLNLIPLAEQFDARIVDGLENDIRLILDIDYSQNTDMTSPFEEIKKHQAPIAPICERAFI